MEELLVYAILLSEKLATENEYCRRLDELFLAHPENDDLLCLEWETNKKKAILYIKIHMDYANLDSERFGRILMRKLKEVYANNPDIRHLANHMFGLWENLPGSLQDTEPFMALCYAADPLSWGDEELAKSICEQMFHYYPEETDTAKQP